MPLPDLPYPSSPDPLYSSNKETISYDADNLRYRGKQSNPDVTDEWGGLIKSSCVVRVIADVAASSTQANGCSDDNNKKKMGEWFMCLGSETDFVVVYCFFV